MAAMAVSGNREKAAEKLGISPRTLRYKINKLRDLGMAVPTAYARV
jgi:two-component system response regulator FlrC